MASPLGSSGGGFDPFGGDSVAVVNAVVEIVPVRIVNTNPILVTVTNFPGQPPPLPGLTAPGVPPPLPSERVRPAAAKGGLGLSDLGLGNLAKLATGAGLAAAGIGLVAGGLHELKGVFIDPILGAAHSGFHAGVSRGAGADVLGKSFEVLGVAVGTLLLPVTIKLAASALVLAENFDQISNNPFIRGLVSGAGGAAAAGGGNFLGGLGGALGGLPGAGGFLGGAGRVMGGGLMTGPGKAAADVAGAARGTQKQQDQALADVVQALRSSVAGTQASYHGIADVRQQAQLAALNQDPLERRVRELMLKALDKYLGKDGSTGAAPGPAAPWPGAAAQPGGMH